MMYESQNGLERHEYDDGDADGGVVVRKHSGVEGTDHPDADTESRTVYSVCEYLE
jgi:hypothetical protein